MMTFVGHYTNPKMVVAHPDLLEVLKEELGLTTIIIGGAYNLSKEARAKNPLPADVSSSIGPGIALSDDDELIRRAIDVGHERGLQVWLCTGGFRDGLARWPDLLAQDMYGRPLSDAAPIRYALTQEHIPFCPTNEQIRAWFTAAYADIAHLYEADGLDVTHYRYTSPSFFDNLFGCACPRCQGMAEEMGTDFERMKRSVLRVSDRLHHLTADAVKRAASLGLTFLDFLQILDHDGAAIADWFDFRADVVTRNLMEIKEAVDAVAREGFVFGCDTYVPSFSMLVGHRYGDYKKFSAYTSPLISWTDYFILATFAAHANLLCTWADGLEERDALRAVYRFYGYGDLPMPETIAEMELGAHPGQESPACVPIYEIMEMEMRKARLYNTGEIPSYPVVKGVYWPKEVVQGLVRAAEEMGHEGIIYHQGTSSVVASDEKWKEGFSVA